MSFWSDYEIALALENFLMPSPGKTPSVRTSSEAEALSAAPCNNYLATHLLSNDLGMRYRSGSLSAANGSVTLDLDLGSPHTIDAVILAGTNIIDGTLRADGHRHDPAVSSPLVTSGTVRPVTRASLEDFSWLDMPWTLGPTQRQIERMRDDRTMLTVLPVDLTRGVRFVRVTYECDTDRLNDGIDHIEISLPIVTKLFRPRVNIRLGWSVGMEDDSIVFETEGGAFSGADLGRRRVIDLDFSSLDEPEAWDRYAAALGETGTLGKVWACVEPHKRRYHYRQSFVGNLVNLAAVEMVNLEWPGARGLRIKESR